MPDTYWHSWIWHIRHGLMMTDPIDIASMFAARFWTDVKDPDGTPSIMHALAVALAGRTPEETVVGLLHDIFEDQRIGSFTPADLDLGPAITQALVAISRREDETYHAYIVRVSENPLATRVKLHDLAHNLSRLSRLRYPNTLEKRWLGAEQFLAETLKKGA